MKIFAEKSLSNRRKLASAAILILILIASIYSNTFNASWHFDDEQNILKNKPLHLTELTWENIRNTFFASTDGSGKIYRPVACFTFALNYYFGGLNVFGYHVVNLAIHFFASLFLFLFIYIVLNLPLLKERYGENAYSIALLSTILWAINPLQTQAITYIVQRMASMAGLFYIMSMYFYIKGRISPDIRHRITYYVLCGICSLLAVGSKQNAAMIPISIVIFDLFLIQGLSCKNARKSILILVPMIIIPIIAAILLQGPSIFHPERLISSYDHRLFTLVERLLTQPRIFLFYLSLLFYPMPFRLSLTHQISVSQGLFEPLSTILSILIICLVLIGAVLYAKKWPFTCFSLIFFFLNHLIEGSIFPLELVFEHRNYIPSMFIFVPVVISIFFFLKHYRKRIIQGSIYLFLILFLVTLGHSTFVRNAVWRTDESLWLDAVDKSPGSARARHNLGLYYSSVGHHHLAIKEYESALEQGIETHGDKRTLTYFNLGLAYMNIDELEISRQNLLKAIDLNPRYPDAYGNLGIVEAKSGNIDKAFDHLITSLTYDESSPEVHNNLGYVLLEKGRFEESTIEFQKALDLDPKSMLYRLNLGIAYKKQSKYIEALNCFRAVVKESPKSLLPHLHLAETYSIIGEKESAVRTMTRAIKVLGIDGFSSSLRSSFSKTFGQFPDKHIILPVVEESYTRLMQPLVKTLEDL